VADKPSKTPFPRSLNVANAVHNMGLNPKFGISLYPGTGSMDGVLGDHVLIAPAYGITREEIEGIVELVKGVVEEALREVNALVEG
jgi:adenosylmethionine-8-amino-7-oxononanoate aminotransferase